MYSKDGKALIFYATGKTDGSFVVPDGVTEISANAFYGCISLTSVTIPDSVTNIGVATFYECNSLTSITFNGTTAQWIAIEKGFLWDSRTGNYLVICTDMALYKYGVQMLN